MSDVIEESSNASTDEKTENVALFLAIGGAAIVSITGILQLVVRTTVIIWLN